MRTLLSNSSLLGIKLQALESLWDALDENAEADSVQAEVVEAMRRDLERLRNLNALLIVLVVVFVAVSVLALVWSPP